MTSGDAEPRRPKVAVIGGGISGLAAAHRLVELLGDRVELSVLERGDRLGGVIRTEQRAGFLIEHSADMFTSKDPWALELCQRLGIEDQLVGANESRRKAYVVHRGGLCEVPPGFVLMRPTRIWSMVTTPILSWKGKLRLAMEPFIRARREESDESLASFVTRRLGREVFERIVQPLVGGIYTADPDKLSMNAAMRVFVDMEREHGSLVRAPSAAGEKTASGARYGAFVAPGEGMEFIVRTLADRLPQGSVRLQARIERIERRDSKWRLVFDDGRSEQCDALIAAAGAQPSARMLAGSCEQLSQELAAISSASVAIAVFGHETQRIERLPDGFGFVSPIVEERKILAVSFASHKFPGRAPDDHVLLRVFVGGACQPELLDQSDEEILELAWEELEQLIGARGRPILRQLVRWNDAMPQYHVGHLDRVDRIEQLVGELPNFALATNALRGVGVPFCIHSGEAAAERIAEQF